MIRPMALVSAIYGTDDDDEIMSYLYLIANVSAILHHVLYG